MSSPSGSGYAFLGGSSDHVAGGALQRARLDGRAEFGAVARDALLGVVEASEDLDVNALASGGAEHVDTLLEVREHGL